jgi:carbamoyltransferase
MNILGISAGFHDASVSLINSEGQILFAGHSERYSKKKNDSDICEALLKDAVHYGYPDRIAYYERPWNRQLRQLYSGQGLDWDQLTLNQILNRQLNGYFDGVPRQSYNHHLSHAAAGFQTSPYDRATVVVIDAIGEWDTITIWGAEYCNGQAKYTKLWNCQYPHSIGLYYSALTERIGLRPNEEEYIMMGMAAYGNPVKYLDDISNELIDSYFDTRFKQNLHLGVDQEFLSSASKEDIAASAQSVLEKLVYHVMDRARQFGWSTNLVYMGGVALNCLANRNLGEYFEKIWIMPNPGDAGSSLGASALAMGGRINWTNAYLGHRIPGVYPVSRVLDSLLSNGIVGVASGRAEFGPRALGNRSLLADPRGAHIKDRVNEIKRRQKFRPFAPVILEEHAGDYFDIPSGWSDSRYMQIVGHCRRPDLFPAIVHYDGTSRIQTVPKDGSGIRKLLEAWNNVTGCPMLLNTSLNIRGEPMVNDRSDADRFEATYGIQVVS